MKNKVRYVAVNGHSARHINAVISHNNKALRTYSAFECIMLNGKTRYFSDGHRLVRARRIALCAVFFVELSLDTNNEPACMVQAPEMVPA